ncbi:hypothetical protein ASD43_01540 [Microbacterium sp. Root553]|nr:hypothetical protein ASD43_01540 [Microbacterium sp. Root553]
MFVSWSYRDSGLEQCFPSAQRLQWVHWCGAGVRPALFPALVDSDVVLTNTRGIHDRAMAEYVLGIVLSFALRLPAMASDQRHRRWRPGQAERVDGTRAVIFGVGAIGHRIGALLQAAGVHVTGVGRQARSTDGIFGEIHGGTDRLELLRHADWVISVMPDTPLTEGYFGAEEFAAMRPTARFVNVGRGSSVDETALMAALRRGTIAGAALDVFRREPLDSHSPLWSTPGLLLTPHISGDYRGYERDVTMQFLENLRRFEKGDVLANVVDKKAGYVTTPPQTLTL